MSAAASSSRVRPGCRALGSRSVAINHPLGEADIKGFEAFRAVQARLEQVKYEDFDREIGVFGNPDYCGERVRALHREYRMDEFIL